MTSNEKEVLKIIWQNRGGASISKIANELKISTDYSRLICGSLIKNGVIKFSEGQYKVTKPKKKTVTKLYSLTPKLTKVLKQKRFGTLEDVATISVSRLMEVEDLELKKAAEIINEARDKLRKEGREYLWE